MAQTCLRGLYDITDDEIEPGLVDNSIFRSSAGHFLRFASKEECREFILKFCTTGSNPEYPWLQHIFTMLVSWDQVERFLLDKVDYFNRKLPPRRAPPLDSWSNVYLQEGSPPPELGGEGWKGFDSGAVMRGIVRRLDLPFHQCISPASTRNTLNYLFHHMRCGIFVMIRSNRLAMFVPFVNKDYTNDWGQPPALNPEYPSLKAYYDAKANVYRKENVIPDFAQWWANGNIICNEHQKPDEKFSQYWGDQFMSALRDLLEEACAERQLADCEFFINKRDYPHLKYNEETQKPVEPYGFIFDKDDRNPQDDLPLKRHEYKQYTPIASFYCSDRFADLPFPTSEDWEAATGMVYPKTFSHSVDSTTGEVEIEDPRDLFTEANFVKFACSWEEKVNTAFFRGTATGGGVTAKTNQRIHCSELSHLWKSDDRYNGSDGTAPFLDSAITGWNKRDKKIATEPMKFVKTEDFAFEGGKEMFTPIYQQSKFKYLIYIEGHCAACRYGFMMRLGSVIIKVASSCVADLMWYFPLLQPWVDHVPVKEDLSDLAEKIDWCRSHDEECKAIAQRAGALYKKYVHRSACLDYVQALSYKLNERYYHPPEWVETIPNPLNPPSAVVDKTYKPLCYEDRVVEANSKYCKRCQFIVDEERRRDELEKKRKLDDQKSAEESQRQNRQRMKEKAAKQKKQVSEGQPKERKEEPLQQGETEFQ